MKNTDKGLVSFFAVVISSFNVPKSIRSDEMIKKCSDQFFIYFYF